MRSKQFQPRRRISEYFERSVALLRVFGVLPLIPLVLTVVPSVPMAVPVSPFAPIPLPIVPLVNGKNVTNQWYHWRTHALSVAVIRMSHDKNIKRSTAAIFFLKPVHLKFFSLYVCAFADAFVYTNVVFLTIASLQDYKYSYSENVAFDPVNQFIHRIDR